jgi:hypothetical protein
MGTELHLSAAEMPHSLPAVVQGRRVRLDGRTKICQRAKRLRAHYFALLEHAGRDVRSVELVAAVDRACELQAIAEHLRADAMKGRAVFDDLVRIERIAHGALRALRLPSGASKPTLTLAAYLSSRTEETSE